MRALGIVRVDFGHGSDKINIDGEFSGSEPEQPVRQTHKNSKRRRAEPKPVRPRNQSPPLPGKPVRRVLPVDVLSQALVKPANRKPKYQHSDVATHTIFSFLEEFLAANRPVMNTRAARADGEGLQVTGAGNPGAGFHRAPEKRPRLEAGPDEQLFWKVWHSQHDRLHRLSIRLMSANLSPEESLIERQEAETLIGGLHTLPQGLQEPLLMRCLGDMSYDQISETLGLTNATARKRVELARKQLRGCL